MLSIAIMAEIMALNADENRIWKKIYINYMKNKQYYSSINLSQALIFLVDKILSLAVMMLIHCIYIYI